MANSNEKSNKKSATKKRTTVKRVVCNSGVTVIGAVRVGLIATDMLCSNAQYALNKIADPEFAPILVNEEGKPVGKIQSSREYHAYSRMEIEDKIYVKTEQLKQLSRKPLSLGKAL